LLNPAKSERCDWAMQIVGGPVEHRRQALWRRWTWLADDI